MCFFVVAAAETVEAVRVACTEMERILSQLSWPSAVGSVFGQQVIANDDDDDDDHFQGLNTSTSQGGDASSSQLESSDQAHGVSSWQPEIQAQAQVSQSSLILMHINNIFIVRSRVILVTTMLCRVAYIWQQGLDLIS